MRRRLRLTWVTDLHWTYVERLARGRFMEKVRKTRPDVLVVTGDTGESQTVQQYVEELYAHAGVPVYFVMGNHCYYGSSVAAMRERLAAWDRAAPQTTFSYGPPAASYRWLQNAGVIPLTDRVALVGVDGWADGRYSDWMRSPLMLRDHEQIEEIARADPIILARYGGDTLWQPAPDWPDALKRLRALADGDAALLYATASEALRTHESVIVATHIPPFPQNALHDRKISDPRWLPHFTSKATGDVLLRLARENQSKSILTLCGHAHEAATHRPLHNLTVQTGAAEYHEPLIAGTFELD